MSDFISSAWLSDALAYSGMSQSELSRRLTDKLGRSVDRAAVNKMLSGQRVMRAEELLAVGAITGCSLVPYVHPAQEAAFKLPPARLHGPRLYGWRAVASKFLRLLVMVVESPPPRRLAKRRGPSPRPS